MSLLSRCCFTRRTRASLEEGGGLWYAAGVKNAICHWLFDLDNTLYPSSCGLFDVIDERINLYLKEFLGVHPRQADSLRRGYFEKYGLTLVGLMRERDVDPAHYMEFVHQVPLGDYLKPNPSLPALLHSIPVPKTIFTNGSRGHSLAVVRALGLEGVFTEIYDIASFGYIPKPDPLTYRTVLDRLGLSGPEVVLVDDLERNLSPARELGMKTIFVGAHGESAVADFSLSSLEDLPVILPQLPH